MYVHVHVSHQCIFGCTYNTISLICYCVLCTLSAEMAYYFAPACCMYCTCVSVGTNLLSGNSVRKLFFSLYLCASIPPSLFLCVHVKVAAYPQQMSIKPNLWLDHDTAIPDHRQAFDEDDRLPQPPNLGPIGPPSKFSKPPQGGVSKPIPPGTRGDIGAPGRVEGGRFSPIGSRGTRTSPNSGTTASPQRSSDPSPVAKSPLLGPAPPGGLLPTPEKCEYPVR